jgi:hypothetical protein
MGFRSNSAIRMHLSLVLVLRQTIASYLGISPLSRTNGSTRALAQSSVREKNGIGPYSASLKVRYIDPWQCPWYDQRQSQIFTLPTSYGGPHWKHYQSIPVVALTQIFHCTIAVGEPLECLTDDASFLQVAMLCHQKHRLEQEWQRLPEPASLQL